MDPAPSAAGTDILSTLRAATGEAHQQLEDAVAIEHCVTDLARYRRLLKIFLGFYRPLESRLAALPDWDRYRIDFPARRKTPWLVADLLALELTISHVDVLPDCSGLPPTDTLAGGFGCLYVLEGATLGGRQITALLRESPVPTTARHFFNSYGAETGTRWREFLTALESHAAAHGTDRAEIVHAAQETFACLRGWFVRECGAHEHLG